MLRAIPNIDSNYRTGKIPTAKIQYRTTLVGRERGREGRKGGWEANVGRFKKFN